MTDNQEDLSSDFHRNSLFQAITTGQFALVKTLLEKGIHPNFLFLGTTPLHSAVKEQSNDIIEALLDAGSDINKAGRYGRTPLHVAALHGHVEQIRCLISNGASVNLLDEDGNTALICNAVVNSKSLQLACLELLFDAGADPGIPNKKNQSILGNSIYPVATDFYHYMMTRKLIVKALDADPKSHSLCLDSESLQRVLMKNALSALKRNDANELARILPGIKDIELKCSGAPLLHHAMDDKVDHDVNDVNDVNDVVVYPMMDVILKHGVNVDVLNSSKITALHLACTKSQAGKARYLISRGANMNAKDANGDTPLHMAMSARAFECVELLLQSGANAKATNMFGLTFGASAANEASMVSFMSWRAQRSAYKAIEEIKLLRLSEAPEPVQKISASAKP